MSGADDGSGSDRDPLARRDDVVAAFALDGRPLRGRVVRLGGLADEILSAHDYPEPVAAMLAEAVMVAILIGASLKIKGKLQVQASAPGAAVPLLLADYETPGVEASDTPGAVRGYAKVDPDAYAAMALDTRRPDARALLAGGKLALTIDQGPDFNRYQSVTAVEDSTLAAAAEAYFEASEQVPTRIRMAVARARIGDGPAQWRAGGAIIQQVAGDEARGATAEDWDHARALFETVAPDELVDPRVSAGELLYRLFHEEGVRLFPGVDLVKRCPCRRDNIRLMMASFPEADVRGMATAEGRLEVTCEYCNRVFDFTPEEVDAVRPGGS